MMSSQKPQKLGLEVSLQRPDAQDLSRIPPARDQRGNLIFPEVDADGDHVHFEMVPMNGGSVLWLTIRRGTSPQLASGSLRKIADLIDRHGLDLLNLAEGKGGSFSAEGDIVNGPLRLQYDENGDLVFPA